MSPKFRNRLIILSLSVLLMVALFIISLNRGSNQNLPPTPTAGTALAENQETGENPDGEGSPGNTPTSSPTSTATIVLPTTTPDYAAATSTAEARIIATAEAGMIKATQRARAMSNIVHGLYDEGVVADPRGSYKKIDDFTTTFNRSGYYQMHTSEYDARYFVIRANLLWDNAGEEISYPTAGCGLVFSYQDVNNHFRVFLNLDGNVRLHRMLDGEFTLESIDYVGPLKQPAGHANLILAVDQDWITVYVDNQQITRIYDENIQEGKLAYAIAAGSSYDYGTLCEFKDIELWRIE